MKGLVDQEKASASGSDITRFDIKNKVGIIQESEKKQREETQASQVSPSDSSQSSSTHAEMSPSPNVNWTSITDIGTVSSLSLSILAAVVSRCLYLSANLSQ